MRSLAAGHRCGKANARTMCRSLGDSSHKSSNLSRPTLNKSSLGDTTLWRPMQNGPGSYLSSAFVDVVNRNDIVPTTPILLLRDVRHFARFHGRDRDLQLSSIADHKRVGETWFSEQCSFSVCTFIGTAKTRCQRATNT
jgi:hypothetical protein